MHFSDWIQKSFYSGAAKDNPYPANIDYARGLDALAEADRKTLKRRSLGCVCRIGLQRMESARRLIAEDVADCIEDQGYEAIANWASSQRFTFTMTLAT